MGPEDPMGCRACMIVDLGDSTHERKTLWGLKRISTRSRRILEFDNIDVIDAIALKMVGNREKRLGI